MLNPVLQTAADVKIDPDDVMVSYLPLAHSYEQMIHVSIDWQGHHHRLLSFPPFLWEVVVFTFP